MAFKFATSVKDVPKAQEVVVELQPVFPIGQAATIESVTEFVRMRKRAACSELKIAFNLTYYEAVKWMDALEERGVVPPCKIRADGVPFAGARPVNEDLKI